MLKDITAQQALEDFLRFWQVHFPEQDILSRQDALASIDDVRRGQQNVSASQQETVVYQNDVSAVYGAYELAQFQLATLPHVIRLTKKLPAGSKIVSLGCGPASYELWLATQTDFRFTLVDFSPGMLERAQTIAYAAGVSERVTFIESDVANVVAIDSHTADLALCLNSMHWSANWDKWIEEAARIVKRGSLALFTCSFGIPRSRISPESLAASISRYFTNEGADSLVPPVDVGGGMAAVSMRFYAIGRRKQKPPKPKKRK